MKQVNSQDFQRHFGVYQDLALTEPLAISKHGHPRLILMSVAEYQRLKKKGTRKALHVTELSDRDLQDIANSQMPAGYAHLDDELSDS